MKTKLMAMLLAAGAMLGAWADTHNKVQLWENGPYWAETNIGADEPWDSGYYFWWGDTIGYKQENNVWVASNGSTSNFSFSDVPTHGKLVGTLLDQGWIDADYCLTMGHDAAQAHWGGGWRLPTYQESSELVSKCTWLWTTTNGVKGYVVRGKGDYASKSIFLPAAGFGRDTSLTWAGSSGRYWSSFPVTGTTGCARGIKFASGEYTAGSSNNGRSDGFSVRPVSEAPWNGDLSKVTSDVTVTNGVTLTGTLAGNYKVSIADGATVTLDGVSINADGAVTAGYYAGITCNGNATIVLEGTNVVKGFNGSYPGIYVPVSCTVTIQGEGTLDVSSNGAAAGIGGGYEIDCGNIVIAGGTINATGGSGAAGIGSGGNGRCGNITIVDSVTSVTAIKGSGSPNSIGAGAYEYASCGTVTIGDVVGAITESPYTYCPADAVIAAIAAIGEVSYTDESKALIDASRTAYDALTDAQKALVGNYATLTAAETAYAAFKAVVEALSGSGTEADPYLIGTYDELKGFASRVNGGETNAWAVLTADITATDTAWTPIGNEDNMYTGTFDGQNHKIANLSNASVSPAPEYAGLFGAIGPNGTVRNVKLVDVDLTATDDSESSGSGGVVGYNSSGVVKNCSVSGVVRYGVYSGGVVGLNLGGTVVNCCNAGNVSGFVAGGIACYNISGTVENNYNTGNVSGRGASGGIVGASGGEGMLLIRGVVRNCLNTGAVEVTDSDWACAGGVVGVNGECGTVENCCNTGSVTGGKYVGGVAGRNDSDYGENAEAKVFHCYALDSVADGVAIGLSDGGYEVVDVRALSEAEFKTKANFVGWDFTTVWYMGANAPMLRAFGARHDKVQLWEGGPYWATTNIGAEKPEDYGYYFWWGDTIGYKREGDAWVATDGSSSNFEFYNNPISMSTCKAAATLRNDGWIITKDDENHLVPEHDAAHVQWGGDWRMPTGQEIDELHEQCEWTWTTTNGVNGYIVRGRGDYASSCIFIPAAGYGDESLLSEVGISDGFWSSVTYWHASTSDSDSYYSKYLGFDYSCHSTASFYRYYGRPVRPVCPAAASGAKFAAGAVRASESGTVKLTVYGGSLTGPSSVKVFMAYQTAAAADLDFANATVNGVKVKGGLKFPLALAWDTGDLSPVTIEIPVKPDKSVEDGETFTFQIADVVGTEIGEALECTVTLDDPGYAELADKIKDGTATKAESNTWTKASHEGIPYMRGLAYPADGGKVTGSAYCPENKKVTLKASANKGWKFLGWRQETGNGEWGTGNGFVATTASLVIDRTAKPAKDTKTSTTLAGIAESTTFYAVFEGDPRVTATPVAFDEEKGLFVASDGGKVTGAGRYAPGKKVTLKATANKGFAFGGWYDVNGKLRMENGKLAEGEKSDEPISLAASLTFEMGEKDIDLYARFVTVEADKGSIRAGLNGGGLPAPAEGEPVSLETNVMAGVYLEWPIAAEALSQPTVKVAGLPSGLKFTAKDIVDSKTKQVTVPANTIYGAPTAASKTGKDGKPTPSSVKVTVTTAGKSSATYEIALTVDPLPNWAVGNFDGAVGAPPNGTVALTIATSGKISGKILEGGRTWSLSAAAFSRAEVLEPLEQLELLEPLDNRLVFYATVIAKSGTLLATNEIAVAAVDGIGVLTGTFELSNSQTFELSSYQNLWKRADTKAAQPVFKKNIVVEHCFGAEGDKNNTVKITFKKDGAVSFSGKIGGVSVSGSAQIVWDGKGWKMTVYAPPKPKSKPPFDGWCETFPVKLTMDEQNIVTKVELGGEEPEMVQLWEGGPYWATRNIGAEKPEDSGYYFWWGDTIGYKWENKQWVASDGSVSGFSFRDVNAPTDNKDVATLQSEGWITSDGVLAPEHDAAQVQWGGDWRMPTYQELNGLIGNCDWEEVNKNGVNGYIVRGRGDYASNSIFLPCTGYVAGTSLSNSGSRGYYWSSVPYSYSYFAYVLYFYSGDHGTGYNDRSQGHSVRPVQSPAE